MPKQHTHNETLKLRGRAIALSTLDPPHVKRPTGKGTRPATLRHAPVSVPMDDSPVRCSKTRGSWIL